MQPDPAAVEHDRRGVAAADEAAGKIAAGAVDRHAAERERALVLQEEVAFLRKEQIESREVDLLLVRLDLREVGVDRQVGDESLRHGILHVETGLRPPDRSRSRGVATRVRRQARDRVRLDIQVGAARAAPRSPPAWPRIAPAGIQTVLAPAARSVSVEISFFERFTRIALKPHTCVVPG